MSLLLSEATYVTTKRVNPAFGEAVARVLDSHGLSLRAARIRTGIDHVTLSDMRAGYVPRMEKVVQFARGFNLDVNEWLELAGFDPLPESTDPADLASRLLDAVEGEADPAPLTYEPDFSGEAMYGLTGDLSPEARRRMEKALRVLHQAELKKRGAG